MKLVTGPKSATTEQTYGLKLSTLHMPVKERWEILTNTILIIKVISLVMCFLRDWMKEDNHEKWMPDGNSYPLQHHYLVMGICCLPSWQGAWVGWGLHFIYSPLPLKWEPRVQLQLAETSKIKMRPRSNHSYPCLYIKPTHPLLSEIQIITSPLPTLEKAVIGGKISDPWLASTFVHHLYFHLYEVEILTIGWFFISEPFFLSWVSGKMSVSGVYK